MTELAPRPELIRATYGWLAHGAYGVSEVRVIRPGAGILGIGFFDCADAFVRECVRANAAGNVYVGIQPRPRRLLGLAPNVVRPLKSGAGAKDIEHLTATVIDLDPVRPKDTASTDAELAGALAAAEAAAGWCESEGLLRPRLVMSGNGAQLWFALPPTALEAKRKERLQAGLKAFEARVRARVQSQAVRVDSIHDLARIIKVVGTVSRKGDGEGERPHRVSTALSDLERMEDARLFARLDEPPQPALPVRPAPRARLPVLHPPVHGNLANRTPDGGYDWEHPVEMCGPVQRLWDQGADDRSVAIFNMVRFFAHKRLPLAEITDLVLAYDRRALGKLQGRDGAAYVRQAYEKVLASVRDDDSIAPPCHALQALSYCRVNREPGVRCELYDAAFDIEGAIEAIPSDAPPRELEGRLRPILDAVAHRDPAIQGAYLSRIAKRFSIESRDLRRAIKHAKASPRGDDVAGAPGRSRDAIDGEIYEGDRSYYCLSAKGEAKIISSFIFQPTARALTEDGECIVGDAHTDQGRTLRSLRLPLSAFHSKRDLIRHLGSAELQWTGSDNNVQGLLRVLARRPVPRRPGSKVLGEYRRGDHLVWLGPDSAIGKKGFIEPPPVTYLPSGASLATRLAYRPCSDGAFQRVARTVFRFLPRLNTPDVILPVLGWFFATPMKPQLMKAVGSFPVLCIWGTQGSGKSSLCSDIMWPLFGARDAEPYSATETEFALLKLLSSTCSVPVFIDEYKPFDMPKPRLTTLHRCLRRLYRGEVEERGRPDLTTAIYHLQAPLCIAGENRPDEAALLERLLTSNPSKTALEQNPAFRHAHRELRAVDLSLFAPRYIQFCLGRDFAADLAVAHRTAERLLGERTMPMRTAQNLTAMLLGIHLFEEFAKSCHIKLGEELRTAEAVNGVLLDVLEGGQTVQNALDAFLQLLGVMAVQGHLQHGVHYVVHGGLLGLHLESAYDAFRAHCKRIDYEGEIVGLRAMKQLIQENRNRDGFVVSESQRLSFQGREVRRQAVMIDLAKTSLLNADDFPRPSEAAGSDFRSVVSPYDR